MAASVTRAWLGGIHDWSLATNWSPAGTPQLNDFLIVNTGTVLTPGAEGNLQGTYDAFAILLGSASPAAPAMIAATSASFNNNVVIASAGSAAFAVLATAGVTGFAGTIEADAAGGNFTIQATQANGSQAAAFVLRGRGTIEVGNGDLMTVNGTMLEHGVMKVDSGLNDTGVISVIGGTLTVGDSAALGGPGLIDIGLAGTVELRFGAANLATQVQFIDVGGLLKIGNPNGMSGLISNFALGDVIDLPNIPTNLGGMTYNPVTRIADIFDNGSLVGQLTIQATNQGSLTLVSDLAGGVAIVEQGFQNTVINYNIAGGDRAMGANVVRATMHTKGGAPITGAGVKIGIISNSFNALGTAYLDIATGLLPSGANAVQIVGPDLPTGDDEGRAMAEFVHQIAPGAQIFFASGTVNQTIEGGSQSMADAVNALVNAQCTVIVDDISVVTDPFFQIAGPLDTAVEGAIAKGVSYFTSADNFGTGVIQLPFTPASVALHDQPFANVPAMIFSNGTPYEIITAMPGATITLQWDAAYPALHGSVTQNLAMKLYDMAGNLLQTSDPPQPTGSFTSIPEATITVPGSQQDPVQQYQLAVYQPPGAGAVGQFKMLMTMPNGGAGVFDDPADGSGGSAYGHAILPDVNTIGAVNFADTPAFGATVGFTEFFSGTGPSSLLFDNNGNRLASPVTTGKVDLLAPDGVQATQSVTGFQPFFGTSAAAPAAAAVAALMQQADSNLTPAQISSMLAASAITLGLPTYQQGAGLIQAVGAVQAALAAACYAAGTAILTPSGEVPIEALRPGDFVATLAGLKPVRWIGRRHIERHRHPRPQEVTPVRIQKDAFGPGLPLRSLRVSPGHAIYVDNVLIPIDCLVNGASIAREPVDTITYFHIELDRHGVLLAEGLPAESYLDTGNRSAFENAGALADLLPDFMPGTRAVTACAPMVRAGPILTAIRARLLDQAVALGHAITADAAPLLLCDSFTLKLCGGADGWIHADLPAGLRELRLASRSSIAAEVLPEHQDFRRLGVAVSAIELDAQPLDLLDPRLGSGWHTIERGDDASWRWTDGSAVIATGGARRLALRLLPQLRYWSAPPTRFAGTGT